MNLRETPISDVEKFRQEKHKNFNTPDEIIGNIVEKATGSQISDKNRIIGGETNEVHQVQVKNGKKIIVRIFHGEKARFEKEKWAIEQCANVGVPVPEILLVDKVEVSGKILPVCVESKIEGVGLGDIEGITNLESDLELRNLLNKLGGVLGKIHEVKTNGFGSLDKDGNGSFKTVRELFTMDQYISKDKIFGQGEAVSFDSSIVNRVYEILQREADVYPEEQPRLIHGDLAPQHILIDNNEIVGLIDFESATGADPVSEFARWEIKFGDKYPIKYIQEGYGNKELFSKDFEKRKNTWRLYQGLVSLSYCVGERKQFGIDKAMSGLIKTLQYFT